MTEAVFISSTNLIVFAVAAFACYYLTFVCIRVSHRFDLLDYPVGRKAHAHPMPFLGGAAVFVSFWGIILIGIMMAHLLNAPTLRPWHVQRLLVSVTSVTPKILGIFLGSIVIYLVGLFDDKFQWSPKRKLAGQIFAAGILMSLGLTINVFTALGPVGYVITFIWILLIMNAFNFIDSLDGHCTGVALISAIVFFWMTQIIHQPMVGLLLITFAGALAGFFPHNFKPARIFLGDNGSLFIGYMMAAFTLLCSYQAPQGTYATIFIPVLVFGVPIYDTMSVIIIRLMRGQAPWYGDRNHFAHRLVRIGMNEKVAVIFSYFVALTIGLVAILTTQVTLFGAVLIGLIFLCIIGVISFLEFYSMERIKIADKIAKKRRRRHQEIQDEEEKRY